MNERNEQIKKVLSDEAFVKTLLEAENEEAVQKMLADKGVDMSLTEIEIMSELIEGLQDGKISAEQLEQLSKNGELSEEDLETAAGGSDIWGNLSDAIKALKELTVNISNEEYASALKSIDNAYLQSVKDSAGYIAQVGSSAASSGTSVGMIVGGVVAGAAAVAGLSYGIYNAVRRRW